MFGNVQSREDLIGLVMRMAYLGQEGHVPSSLAILDIIRAVYGGGFVQKDSPSDFVLSKGHGCLSLYATLALEGYFPVEWLDTFAKFDSPLGGHPDRTQVPGVLASTGSLGHGLPFAAGRAYGKKASGQKGTVYVLVGDGEANEGTVWETALLAAHHCLNNLVCIIDDNDSSTRAINMGSISQKFKAFDWEVLEIDGHDLDEILSALSHQPARPLAIVARTVKGFGIPEMENNPAWHHTRISPEDLKRFGFEVER